MIARLLQCALAAVFSGIASARGMDTAALASNQPPGVAIVDASSLRGKVMCGYQGWFRCPGDGSGLGWVHWSRDSQRIAPELLTFAMWPDIASYPASEHYPAPGFTYPDGRPAELFSSANARTVLRHFEWMRDYGIDGVWLQHFVVDLPDGPGSDRYPSRLQVLNDVRLAARQTGRVWALTYDLSGMPADRIFDVLTADWKRMVDGQVTDDPRYLHQAGKPVVQLWGFYHGQAHNPMSPELAGRLIDFFGAPGRYSAFLVGGGDWNWRHDTEPAWRDFYRRFGAFSPWNVGNYFTDSNGVKHAATSYWAQDKLECERHGMLWIPVVYPGFNWDNLQRLKPGTSSIPRRGGAFLWEQFHALSELGADTVFVAMFDEVDEGTAIFKVTSSPPAQANFVGYEGLPSDWYLRVVGEAARRLKEKQPIPEQMPKL